MRNCPFVLIKNSTWYLSPLSLLWVSNCLFGGHYPQLLRWQKRWANGSWMSIPKKMKTHRIKISIYDHSCIYYYIFIYHIYIPYIHRYRYCNFIDTSKCPINIADIYIYIFNIDILPKGNNIWFPNQFPWYPPGYMERSATRLS